MAYDSILQSQPYVLDQSSGPSALQNEAAAQNPKQTTNTRKAMQAETAQEVKKGTLPVVTLHGAMISGSVQQAQQLGTIGSRLDQQAQQLGTVGSGLDQQAQQRSSSQPSTLSNWFHGVENVAEDLGKGAYEEVKDHPMTLLADAAIGAGVAVGVTLLAPEAAFAAGVAGLAYGGYELYKNGGTWLHEANVVMNQDQYSAQDVAKAHQGLQNVGADATQVVAGVTGGVAVGVLGGVASEIAGEYIPGGGSNLVGEEVGAGTPETPVVAPGSMTDSPGVTVASSDGQGMQPADGNVGEGRTATVATEAEQAKPVENEQAKPGENAQPQTLEESIAQSKQTFQDAKEDGNMMAAKKKLYQVNFQQVSEPQGRYIQTLENRDPGQFVKPGEWYATRLDAQGQPVIEDGVTNQWGPISEKTMLKTYQTTPDEIDANSNFTASTRVDAPPVHMAQLQEPTTIQTSWGDTMSGQKGDWLANYDYDAATGQPGNSYAIVTNKSFGETYEPVQEPAPTSDAPTQN